MSEERNILDSDSESIFVRTADRDTPPALIFDHDSDLHHIGTSHNTYDEAQLEAFAKVVSPKVSELLMEQAMVLDSFLGNEFNSSDDESAFGGRHKGEKKKSYLFDDEEDDIDDEWKKLESAQVNLRNELALASGLSAFLLKDRHLDAEHDDERNHHVEDHQLDRSTESGHHFIAERSNNAISTTRRNSSTAKIKSQDWTNSIRRYYTDNTQSVDSAKNMINNESGHEEAPSYQNKATYSLSDHAVALDVARSTTDRGLFSKPLLSRGDLETLGIVTLPDWMIRSGRVNIEPPTTPHSNRSFPSPFTPDDSDDIMIDTNAIQSQLKNVVNTSVEEEAYIKQILMCTAEYVEPPKSKTLRKLFSGWNPGPGERRDEDENTKYARGEDTNRVTSYAHTRSPDETGESSDENENDEHDFIDIDGVPYPSSQSHRPREPLPVRTVSVRIRPDILCGSLMDALTTTVERLGGEITKRQGGHLRAVLPARRHRISIRGETKKSNRNTYTKGAGDALNTPTERIRISDDDTSSIVSGLSSLLFSSPVQSHSKSQKGPSHITLPPFLVDTQLVTKKLGKVCQRLLLIRVYRIQDVACLGVGEAEHEEILDVPSHIYTGSENSRVTAQSEIDLESESEQSLRRLRETSALVQRIKAVGSQGFAIDQSLAVSNRLVESDGTVDGTPTSTTGYLKIFGDAITSPIRYFNHTPSAATMAPQHAKQGIQCMPKKTTLMDLMSEALQRKCRPSPSVGNPSSSAFNAAKLKSYGVFPSLSKEDSPYVKASWVFLRECIYELDQRCLSYSTLGISPIFEFPALPTLDNHFVSQIKALCRESMIRSLVTTASELEVYAREFELSCSNLDQLLRPTYKLYRMEPPPLPSPLPLTAYPLDFQAPEDIMPPWGPEVTKAMNMISDVASTTKQDKVTSFDKCEEAEVAVLMAFQRQNDIEQGARLGRKNMQVMDRLAKMQAHKRTSIAWIKNSYGSNLLATQAADEFHSLRLKSTNAGSLSDVINSIPDQVPLLICNVLVGNAAGTCFVTSSQILFVTQLVPIFGGNRVHLFSLIDIEVTIKPPSKSMLSALPSGISLTTSTQPREEIYSFIPSIGAHRLAKFLEIVKDVAIEDPDTLKFSERGGLIYMYDEKI